MIVGKSNCIWWTWREYRAQHRAWVAKGRPVGFEPYLVRRPTRLRVQPTWWCPEWLCNWIVDFIQHSMVGAATPDGQVAVRGVVPADPVGYALTPFQLLRVLWFDARETNHDRPVTVSEKEQ